MKNFISFLCLLYAFNAAYTESDEEIDFAAWESFKNEYGKSYKSADEEKVRSKIFMHNKRLVDEHNKKFYNGEELYEMGINDLSDLRLEELVGNTEYIPELSDPQESKQVLRGEHKIQYETPNKD